MTCTRLPIVGTAPPEPLTLAEAKAHLRVTCTDEDAYLTALITTARAEAENRLQRSLVPSAWRVALDAFPGPAYPAIRLPMAPVTQITTLRYWSSTGVLVDLDPAAWLLDAYSAPARLVPAPGTQWPADAQVRPGAVVVDYLAGYTTPADVPMPIKQWMLLAMGDMDTQRARSADRPAVPQHFADALLDTYRVWSI